MKHDQKKKSHLYLLVLTVLAAIGLAAVYFLQTLKIASLTRSVATLSAQIKQFTSTQQVTGTLPESTVAKQFIAKNFGAGVGFSYPSNWGEYTVYMDAGEKGKAGQMQFHDQNQIVSAFFPSKDFVWLLAGEGLPHPTLFPPMKPISCAELKRFKTVSGYIPFANIDFCEAVKSADEMPTIVFHAPAGICNPNNQFSSCESAYSAILYFTNYGDYPVLSLSVVDYPQSHLSDVRAVAKSMHNEFKPE
ncbi:MAG: hypothetical protein WCJ29_03115 [bacterium]